MKKLSFLLLILSSLSVFSQDATVIEQDAPDLYFNQAEFDGHFAVMTEFNDQYRYFVVDLTRFSSAMEKIYFLNLIYTDNTIISIDSDVSKDQLWFKVPVAIAEDDAVCSLEDHRDMAIEKINAMTEEERSAWLAKQKKLLK